MILAVAASTDKTELLVEWERTSEVPEVATDILANRVPVLRDEELRAQLRLQGAECEADVAHAYIEHDGRTSVIRKDGARPEARPGKAGIRR